MSEYNANIRLSESKEEVKSDLKRDIVRNSNMKTFERERAIKELKWQTFTRSLTVISLLVILLILFFFYKKYS